MADEDKHALMLKSDSPMIGWNTNQSPHIYPRSHHGTPAQEYSGFVFDSPPLSVSASAGGLGISEGHRPYHQLHQLAMPQWPSMLNGHQTTPQTFQPSYSQSTPTVQTAAAGLLIPISATPMRSSSGPRRTLTDTDRKEMCLFAEKHPDKKQTEIGAMFGVERSTVSKVLRQREKYLAQDEPSRSPVKRLKGRTPDIERALAVWAKNQEKKGFVLTNDMIRDKARAFLATTSTPDSHPALGNTWIEKFRMKNCLAGAKPRKKSSSILDGDIGAPPVGGASPRSSPERSTPELHPSTSLESLTDESTEYHSYNFSRRPSYTHSIQSRYAHSHIVSEDGHASMSPASSLFTPESGTASRPFIPPQHVRANNITTNVEQCDQRPRRQTFPLIDQYPRAVESSIKYESEIFGSPLQYGVDIGNLDPQAAFTCPSQHHDRPRSITPTNAMAPPPLPSQYASYGTLLAPDVKRHDHPQLPLAPAILSGVDARHAIETLYEYVRQQGTNFLNLDEDASFGHLMEKIKCHAQM